jgi:hypothetical protein
LELLNRGCDLQERSRAHAALEDKTASGAWRSGWRRSRMRDAAAALGAGSIHCGQSPAQPASTRCSYTQPTALMATARDMMLEAAQDEARRVKRVDMAGRSGARAAHAETQRARATRPTRCGAWTLTRRPQAAGPRSGERRAKAWARCSQPGATDTMEAQANSAPLHTSSLASEHARAHADMNDSSSLSSPPPVNSGRRSPSSSMLPATE